MSDRRTEARLVLLAHGSRDPGWRAPFERLAQELTKSLGPGRVRLAYLEFNLPTLSDALAEASLEGVSHVRILPLFAASGKHAREDVPREVATAGQATPDTTFELLPPLGDDPRFVALMRTVALEAAPLD